MEPTIQVLVAFPRSTENLVVALAPSLVPPASLSLALSRSETQLQESK